VIWLILVKLIDFYSGHSIGAEGAKSVAAALETNKTITNIDLDSK
jgi:hypothetical protein